MNRQAFDDYCASLPQTTHVVQWQGTSVWKIGGKMFAIAPLRAEGQFQKISFKCSDLSYEILTQQPGIIPSPYLARAKWVQVAEDGALSDADIRTYLDDAYHLICEKLTKKLRKELGV